MALSRWWMVRAGDNHQSIPLWKKDGVASIGWVKLGDPKQYRTKEEMTAKADIVYAEAKPRSRASGVSQVWRFSRDIEEGDHVITYFKEMREYLVGTVTSSHFYDTSIGNPNFPNHVRVKWEESMVGRDLLSEPAKKSLGSILTVFRVDDWGSEIESLL